MSPANMRLVGRGFSDKKFLCEFKAIATDLNNFPALAICPHQLWIDGKGTAAWISSLSGTS